MSSLKLYEIASEYQRISDELSEIEGVTDDAIKDTLEGLGLAEQAEPKIINCVAISKNFEEEAKAIKELENKLKKRREALENKAERIRNYVKQNMELIAITKISCPWFVVQIRNTQSLVEFDNADIIAALPEEFLTIKITKAPNKVALKKAIEDGREVPGVRLRQGRALIIK